METPTFQDESASSPTWFTFASGKVEGPYSRAYIQSQIRFGALDERVLVWSERTDRWVEFCSLSKKSELKPIVRDWSELLIETQQILKSQIEPQQAQSSLDFDRVSRLPSRWALFSIGLILGLSIFAWRFLVPTGQAELPRFSDVTGADLKVLEQAFSTSPKNGLRVAHVPSRSAEPFLYLAGNLPKGTTWRLELVGRAETLVDRLQVQAQAIVKFDNGWTRTPRLELAPNVPLPTGEYNLTLTCIDCPGTTATVVHDSVFWGARDLLYAQQLTLFHERLRAQARAELEEMSQLITTLEKQMIQSNQEFAGARRGHSLRSSTQWAKSSQSWLLLQNQLGELIEQRTTKSLSHINYYDGLYQLFKQAQDLVVKIHHVQDRMLRTGSGDSADLLADEDLVRSAILAIRAKVARLAQAPQQANGLPPSL